MNRVERNVLAALGGLLVAGFALWLVMFGPPDTHRDMNEQLDSLEIPEDFTLVSKGFGGSRSNFAASGRPHVDAIFSAPWDDGRLCGRLAELVSKYSTADFARSHECSFSTPIRSGWRGKLLNVWEYELVAYAISPESVRPHHSDEECRDLRERTRKGHIPDSPFAQFGPCWIVRGESQVTLVVKGTHGW